jgi:S-adenosylmethionine:tRNA ribosyltransferase-isomerase
MLRSRGKVREGEELLGGHYAFQLERRLADGLWHVVVAPPNPAGEVLAQIGSMPIPPYIEKARREGGMGGMANAGGNRPGASVAEDPMSRNDWNWYQTVYAAKEGKSVAAPTAGLHFTGELLGRIAAMGVERADVELQVGPGTFLPVETATLEEHPMHREHYSIPAATVAAIRAARRTGRRIVVVGTTAVRTLETRAGAILDVATPPAELSGETDLKIAPGFRFQLTDVLITNFHLPRSTLMALVGALVGVERLKRLYALAVREGYRFYSFGDAMLILP